MEKLSFSIPRVVNTKKALLPIGQISVLILFWATALNNLNLLLPIIFISILYIAIFRDILLSFIGILFGIVIASVLLKFNFLQSFFENKEILYIYIFIALIEIAIIPVILFSINTRTNSLENSVKELVFSFFLVLSLQLLLRVNIQNDDELSLRYLVPTGEDNASWLSGLGRGISPESTQFVYSSNINQGAGQITGIISLLVRGLISYGDLNYEFLSNLSTLLRIYMICMSICILLVGLLILRICLNLKVGNFASFSIAAISGLSIYLSATSFAIFGHLPPIQSGLVTFLLLAFLSFPKASEKFMFFSPKVVQPFLVILLVVGISEAWHPLGPAIWLAIAFMAMHSLSWQLIRGAKWFLYFFASISICLALFLIANKGDGLKSYLNSKLDEFTFLATMPGGTLGPTTLHILIFSVFIFLNSVKRIDFLSTSQNYYVINSLLTALLIFYFFVILISITTPPNTVVYAGQKLGMFIAFVTLPFSISFLGTFLLRNQVALGSSVIFAIIMFLALFNLGPPSGPSSNSYTQFGSPFGYLKILQGMKGASPNWIYDLMAEMENPPAEINSCFEFPNQAIQGNEDPICAKFASAIKGEWGN
jgi:hypothetical protein